MKATQLIEALFGLPANEFAIPLAVKKWGAINLNDLANTWMTIERANLRATNLLDPMHQEQLLTEAHEQYGIEFSYGGYLEDRSFLLRDTYLPPDGMIHLGVDYNVPAGTPIALPASGRVVFAIHDKDQEGGWGGRVDFFNEEKGIYFILGHLDIMTAEYPTGVWCGKGTTAGFIGNSNENGGWFPHLHLQVVAKDEYERYDDPMKIDGYGKMTPDLESRYLNPEVLI